MMLHKKKGLKVCGVCKITKSIDDFYISSWTYDKLYAWCKDCARVKQRVQRLIYKLEFLVEYGGKCVCCGETNIEFLTVEHKRGISGRALIADRSFGGGLYVNLKGRGWPKEQYEILCFNCNCSKEGDEPCLHTGYSRKDSLVEHMTSRQLIKYNELLERLGVLQC